MSDSYADALTWLYGLGSGGMKLGLTRMQNALEARQHPERGLKFIHVAGSNGKGSTCAMIESSLREAGYKTGFFSSPHLHRYGERIRINGEPLSNDQAAERINAIRSANLDLSFFEITALIALETFRDEGCDAVVLEVGLGGRLDATNVIEHPASTVITNITMEHTRILGDTEAKIAAEKAGIIKEGSPLTIGPMSDEARGVITARAEEVGAKAYAFGEQFRIEGWSVRVGQRRLTLAPALKGIHQFNNAACAANALLRAEGLEISKDAIEKGIAQAIWPGRLERVSGVRVTKEDPPTSFLFDAAHNPDGCEVLAATLDPKGADNRVLLFGSAADKDHVSMLKILEPIASQRVYAFPEMARMGAPERYSEALPGEVFGSNIGAAIEKCVKLAKGGTVVVCGSIFLMSAVRAKVMGLDSDPPIGL